MAIFKKLRSNDPPPLPPPPRRAGTAPPAPADRASAPPQQHQPPYQPRQQRQTRPPPPPTRSATSTSSSATAPPPPPVLPPRPIPPPPVRASTAFPPPPRAPQLPARALSVTAGHGSAAARFKERVRPQSVQYSRVQVQPTSAVWGEGTHASRPRPLVDVVEVVAVQEDEDNGPHREPSFVPPHPNDSPLGMTVRTESPLPLLPTAAANGNGVAATPTSTSSRAASPPSPPRPPRPLRLPPPARMNEGVRRFHHVLTTTYDDDELAELLFNPKPPHVDDVHTLYYAATYANVWIVLDREFLDTMKRARYREVDFCTIVAVIHLVLHRLPEYEFIDNPEDNEDEAPLPPRPVFREELAERSGKFQASARRGGKRMSVALSRLAGGGGSLPRIERVDSDTASVTSVVATTAGKWRKGLNKVAKR